MFALIIVEHFLLCVVCAHKSMAASVRAKEKQKHFSTGCLWHDTKPGSCHFYILLSPEPAIQSYRHRLECIKMINNFN